MTEQRLDVIRVVNGILGKLQALCDRLPDLKHVHWVNVQVRINGKDRTYEADELKAIQALLAGDSRYL